MRQHKDGGTQPAPVPSSHGQMKAQIMRPRWTDNCVHVPWITPSLPSPFPNNPAPLPIKSQRFFGTASPPSNCLPELPPLFLLDAVSPSSAMCPQGPCHQPRALMGPDSPRLEVMADQTLLGIRQRAAFFLWKHLWKALWSHSFKYFCPKRLYFLVKTGHFLTCSTEHLGSGNSARSCAIRAQTIASGAAQSRAGSRSVHQHHCANRWKYSNPHKGRKYWQLLQGIL